MIRSCRREPARHAQAAMDAFERLRWRYGESVGAEQYRLIVEVLWGARRVGDALALLDECERAEKLARACVLAAEGDDAGLATVDLRGAASAEFACARLAHALVGLRGAPVDGLRIYTGGATHPWSEFDAARSPQEAVYRLLQEIGCPLPMLAFESPGAADGGEAAGAAAGCLCTHRGEDFTRWFGAFDMGAFAESEAQPSL